MRPLDALLAESVSAMQAGCWQDALNCLEQAVRLDPRSPEVLNNLGLTYLRLSAAARAVVVLKKSVALRPASPEPHVNLGLALSATGRHKEAVASLTRAIRLAPSDPRAHHDLGTICHAAGRAEAAVDAFNEAVRLNPRFVQAWFNLGNSAQALGKQDAAEQAWRTVVEIEPDHLPAWLNLGASSLGVHRFAEALERFDRVVSGDPSLAIGHNGRGNALHGLGRLDEALAAYAYAAALEPEAAEIQYNLGNQRLELGLVESAIESFRTVLALDPVHASAAQNLLFTLNYSDRIEATESVEMHDRLARVVAPLSKLPVRHEQSPPVSSMAAANRRIHIGFVSGDLRAHSIASFLLPLLESIDRERFHVFCYANVAKPDAMTASLRAAGDEWRDIHSVSDSQVATIVLKDRIDVLVDLSGYTAGQRLAVFAHRAAPRQLSWLGYPNTTGHPAMDARLVDLITDPQQERVDGLASEQLIRLARCFLCYRPPAGIELLSTSIDNRRCATTLSFGSFNNLAKVTAETIAMWSTVLRSVPSSELILKAAGMEQPGVQSRLIAAFADHGIEPQRIRFMPRTATVAEHLALYSQVDTALDTFPYHGTTTTCEALAMGVPVVVRGGDRHASRVGNSLLDAFGQPRWAVDSVSEFAERAVELADDVRAGRLCRNAVRAQLLDSALCDAPAFADAFGDAIHSFFRSSLPRVSGLPNV